MFPPAPFVPVFYSILFSTDLARTMRQVRERGIGPVVCSSKTEEEGEERKAEANRPQ